MCGRKYNGRCRCHWGWWKLSLAQEQLRYKQCLPLYPSPFGGTRTGGKTFQSGEMYGLPPLQLESYLSFVAFLRVTFERQKWERDGVVDLQWAMCYVVQVYVHPSVVKVKTTVRSP